MTGAVREKSRAVSRQPEGNAKCPATRIPPRGGGPEISEVDLNPIFALPEGQGCRIVDARDRVMR